VNIWQRADSFVGADCHPMTWLTSIVRNRSIDTLRTQKNEVSLTREDSENQEDAQMEIETTDLAAADAGVGGDARQVRQCLTGWMRPAPEHRARVHQGLSHRNWPIISSSPWHGQGLGAPRP
jgi:DNA-directed RNA polymerase specialized sigma24 family protein